MKKRRDNRQDGRHRSEHLARILEQTKAPVNINSIELSEKKGNEEKETLLKTKTQTTQSQRNNQNSFATPTVMIEPDVGTGINAVKKSQFEAAFSLNNPITQLPGEVSLKKPLGEDLELG